MEQVIDFLEESETLASAIEAHCDGRWDTPTQFKGWTINDVLVHLHFWNRAADLSLTSETEFMAMLGQSLPAIQKGGLRAMENATIAERGPDLLALWRDYFRDMSTRWQDVDPKARLPWVGPTMSARSSITARQMETWAHGQEVFDLFGVARTDSDRIKNIVVLGVNTFAFSHKLRGQAVPENMPALHLTAPSGEVWEYGDASAGEIVGSAVAFAQTVTQTRSYLDTDLTVTGDIAREWMENAQCFAGPPNAPPQKGVRFKQ
ncbi:MAG: TIGR03084 family metal-binding protein [Shimia sp.]|jgi:uncharacterized protein (TIGR03084 family)|uniref:TIGR03084 family metal-binding protein n=1 Tax=Shimia sp. TaxID=1954381 RepID=UPI0040598463